MEAGVLRNGFVEAKIFLKALLQDRILSLLHSGQSMTTSHRSIGFSLSRRGGIGMAKAGFGGLGMLAILIMARVLPARESTGAILPMLILADVFAVYTYRAHAKGSLVLRMVPPALVGIICGWLLMPHIPAKSFGPFIGWLTLALVVLVLVAKVRPARDEFRCRASRYRLALRMARRLNDHGRQRRRAGDDHLPTCLSAPEI